jgi:hypothetical protein
MKFKSKPVLKVGTYRVSPKYALLPVKPWNDLKLETECTVWLENYYIVEQYYYSAYDGFPWDRIAPFSTLELAQAYIERRIAGEGKP